MHHVRMRLAFTQYRLMLIPFGSLENVAEREPENIYICGCPKKHLR
jgi:hypothetical protein